VDGGGRGWTRVVVGGRRSGGDEEGAGSAEVVPAAMKERRRRAGRKRRAQEPRFGPRSRRGHEGVWRRPSAPVGFRVRWE
jgi:hypothetical protein